MAEQEAFTRSVDLLSSSNDFDQLAEAIRTLRGMPDRRVEDEALLRSCWRRLLKSSSRTPQLDLVKLEPRPTIFRRPPGVVSREPAYGYVKAGWQQRDGGRDYIEIYRAIAADGTVHKYNGFRCERAPWQGLYVIPRGEDPRTRLDAAKNAALVVAVEASGPPTIPILKEWLDLGRVPAPFLFRELKESPHAGEVANSKQLEDFLSEWIPKGWTPSGWSSGRVAEQFL